MKLQSARQGSGGGHTQDIFAGRESQGIVGVVRKRLFGTLFIMH